MAERLPENGEDEQEPEEDGGLPGALVRTLENIGLRGSRLHERAEQLHALYRLLKALGYSDADVARLVAKNAGDRLDESLDRVRPGDARPVFEAVEEALVGAATEVDTRLGLNGDLIRRVRDGAIAARAGREEVLVGLERAIGQGREQFRRIIQAVTTEPDEGGRQ
jgi:hypothetical protein